MSWFGPHLIAAPVALLAAALVARRSSEQGLARVTRSLEGPLAPIALGLLGSVIVFWAWGSSLDQPGGKHDELAYVLQSRIFAAGHLAAPAPPLPEFFEQLHVLVTPRLAPKY